MSRLVNGLRATLRRHSYSLFSSLGALAQHRFGTAMTVTVLGIAMLLPLGLQIALSQLEALDVETENWAAITVFLDPEAGDARAREIADGFQARPDVAEVAAISPDEGLAEFRQTSGFGDALQALDDNPLPWVLVVTPATADEASVVEADALVDALQTVDGVDFARYDRKWLERLGYLLDLGRALASILTVLFSVAVGVIVANTIRLDVAARTEEIEVLALVGAGPGFIRLPFLYAGVWYGLLGGALALILLTLAGWWLAGPLERLLATYGHPWNPRGLSAGGTLAVLGAGAALGWLGAWGAVQRHLARLRVGGSLGRQ